MRGAYRACRNLLQGAVGATRGDKGQPAAAPKSPRRLFPSAFGSPIGAWDELAGAHVTAYDRATAFRPSRLPLSSSSTSPPRLSRPKVPRVSRVPHNDATVSAAPNCSRITGFYTVSPRHQPSSCQKVVKPLCSARRPQRRPQRLTSSRGHRRARRWTVINPLHAVRREMDAGPGAMLARGL